MLTELKNVVNITTLSMTDKERMDVVERCYSKMKRYRNLVSYYTNKNISVSYLRAKKKNDLDRIMGLYGNMNRKILVAYEFRQPSPNSALALRADAAMRGHGGRGKGIAGLGALFFSSPTGYGSRWREPNHRRVPHAAPLCA